jgi:EAL domain-containing protein (putative c-di-GMP-specific phosphodiesterase class I)
MDVIAEGIENSMQLNILKQQRCNKAQGFLFSPPDDAQTITNYLSHWHRFYV